MRNLFISTALQLSSPFDADAFMGQAYDGELDTRSILPPAGDYRAMVGDFTSESGFRSFVASDRSKNPGKEYTVFTPPFVLQDDPRLAEVKAARDGKEIVVFHKGMFLDLTDQGQLDFSKGRNLDLGQMRDAVGQNNKSGWRFTDLIGSGPVMVKVIHEADQNDETRKFARVSRVVKIS